MKSKDKTNKKKHESTIGKIIYGFLLFMPLLAIGVTCAYAIFNKNAYQSYYGDTINEKNYNEINIDNFKTGNEYIFIFNNVPSQQAITGGATDINCEDIVITNTNSTETTYDSGTLRFFISGNTIQYQIIGNNSANANGIKIQFDFVNMATNNNPNMNAILNDYIYSISYNSYSFVSEVFYYSIDKVQQSPLFNWAEDSAIYTGMTATCNALNITTTFIPLLMTYWLIISIIYFLYDIILIILHVFHRKIHELEESI